MAEFVDDEAPVGVTVERQPDVGTGIHDVALQVDEVGGVQRVGLVVGERPVELEEQREQRDWRQHPEDRRRGVPAHAVACVDRHPQRTETRDVDERPQKRSVVGEHVTVLDGPPRPVEAGHPVNDLVADGGQPTVLADGLRPGATEFDAVVGRRVVAGGEHRSGAVEQTGREVQLIRRRQADPGDVQPLRDDPFGERRRQ